MKLGRRLLGRQKIFTSVQEINRENLLEVLDKAFTAHEQNAREIQFLIEYERGHQPLPRPKTNRKEIDIKANSSLPNYIKRFKVGYNWGSPVMLIQRGDVEIHETDAPADDKGISGLNELLRNVENIGYLDTQMAEFIETGGIGHRMVDIKAPKEFEANDNGSLFHVYTLDSRYAFVVYFNGPGQRKMLGVTYSVTDGIKYFTCFTDSMRYDVSEGEIKAEIPNLLGMIPIVEYERAVDRTGCFERKIPEIDVLNSLQSDFANDSAQRSNEIWWGNDFDFKTDEQGNPIPPVNGQWLLTYSGEGLNPKVQPLSSTFAPASTLEAIAAQRKSILQDCFVPIQYESAGGGSSGTATDMSSGWSAAELDACQEQQMTERGKREELQLIIKAISFVDVKYLPADSPLRSVHASDIDFHFNRRKNYDLTNKANFVAQMLAKGFNGRHVIQAADIFPDNEQVWLDSKDMIEAIQKALIDNGQTDGDGDGQVGEDSGRIQADNSDQTGNSPIIGKI